MFRSILLAFTLMFSTAAFAQTANVPNPCADIAEATRGKSATEIQTILETCRTKASESGSILPEVTPEKAAEWSDAAKGFAEALGIAARELGIATNDFLMSPAGFLLAAILLFNYAGGAIIGLPFSVFTILLMFWLIRRLTTGKVEYEMVPIFWGAFHYRRKKLMETADSIGEDNALLLLLTALGLGFMNIIVWFNVS